MYKVRQTTNSNSSHIKLKLRTKDENMWKKLFWIEAYIINGAKVR